MDTSLVSIHFYLLSEHLTAKRATLEEKSMPSTTIAYHPGLTYGVGVDTPSGEARNIAATGTPNTIVNTDGDIILFSMTQIDTVEDLHTALGISASASGGVGLFSASLRFDYAQSCAVHENSVFLKVSVNVNKAFSQIDKPGIDPIAAELLANGGIEPFQDQYGDMFVRGLETGGLFFATIQIHCKDKTEKESIQAKVSGSYATFSASGTFSKDFTDSVSEHDTTVLCYIEGGDRSKPLPIAVDTMTDRAIHFPAELGSHGVVYAALLDSYSILPLPHPPNYIDLQHQRDVLIECALLRDQDLLALNNIIYILSNPDQFIDPEKFPLSQIRNDLDADLNTIAATASNALNHPKQAVLPQLKVTASPDLPRRKAAPIIEPGTLIKIPEVRGMETGTAEATLVQVGLHSRRVLIENGNNDSPSTGDVAIVEPSVGTLVPVGETIVLTIEMNAMNM
jgi:PASTA domain